LLKVLLLDNIVPFFLLSQNKLENVFFLYINDENNLLLEKKLFLYDCEQNIYDSVMLGRVLKHHSNKNRKKLIQHKIFFSSLFTEKIKMCRAG